MTKEPIANIYVCSDCMEAEEGITEYVVNNNRFEGEFTANWDSNEGDDSGVRDFSWSPCDSCGSTLGGSRYRYAVWSWH